MIPPELATVFQLSCSQPSAAHLIHCYRFCPPKKLLEPVKVFAAGSAEALAIKVETKKVPVDVAWRFLSPAISFWRCLSRAIVSLALTVAVRRVLAPVGTMWRVFRQVRHRATVGVAQAPTNGC